jgi:hypothetical protein
MAVRLIVPDDVVERAVEDLAERRPQGIVRRAARATAALLQLMRLVARVYELLAESADAMLCLGVELTGELFVRSAAAAGKGRGIELEYEPPVDRMFFLQERRRRATGGLCVPGAAGQSR